MNNLSKLFIRQQLGEEKATTTKVRVRKSSLVWCMWKRPMPEAELLRDWFPGSSRIDAGEGAGEGDGFAEVVEGADPGY